MRLPVHDVPNDLALAALDPENEWQVPEHLLVEPPRLRPGPSSGAYGVANKQAEAVASSEGCSEYLTKDEVARILKLATKTIERAILDGEIPAFKFRQRVRICRDDLEVWIESHRVEPSVHDI
jgi:excisionase family DNA binding protein